MSTTQLAALWQEAQADPDFVFTLKAQDVCIQLAAAVARSGMGKSQLAEKLGWTPSRVSHVLNGSANLTLKTIFEITQALGLDFKLSIQTPLQPVESTEIEQRPGLSAAAWLATARRNTCRQPNYVKRLRFNTLSSTP
jgi:transcriptional regulator with XRE-family HTH domain